MVEVKVKVKVSGVSEKKTRKPRKDKGKRRGRKQTKNPQFQKGSLDFRHIGTSQSSNATLLAGLIASRAVVPQYLQPQTTSTELTTYAPRDLPKNVPSPQFRPDEEQAQEETPQYTQVKQAMGGRIQRQNKEIERLQEVSKQIQESNLMAGEELRQKQHELIEQDKDMDLKRKSFLVEQVYTTPSNAGFARIKSQITGIQWTGEEIAQDKEDLRAELSLENPKLTKTQLNELVNKQYRDSLIERAGLDPTLVDFREVKVGERGKMRKDFFYNPQKADLRRAQEEEPEIEESQELFDEEHRHPLPYKAPFVPNEEFVQKISQELAAEEGPRQMSEIEKALQTTQKINKKNEMEELARTAISLDSRLAQRLADRPKPKVANR